jgi:hypothetical protein
MTGVLLLIGGAAILAVSALAWTGRWRSWHRQVLTGPLPAPITLYPAVGFALFGTGLAGLGLPDALAAPFLLALVVLLVLYWWAPSWWGPRWMKEERRDGIEPDMQDPLTALSVGALAPPGPKASSSAAVSVALDGSTPLYDWRATWIQHEGGGEKPHAFGAAGRVTGKIELYSDALAFRASGLEDRMRRQPTVVVVERGAFAGVRTVPAGAGPDGAKRPRAGPRSIFSRLVVDTNDGPLLFEVGFAKRKAERISETFGSGCA